MNRLKVDADYIPELDYFYRDFGSKKGADNAPKYNEKRV
jgi:hypothetical protein